MARIAFDMLVVFLVVMTTAHGKGTNLHSFQTSLTVSSPQALVPLIIIILETKMTM